LQAAAAAAVAAAAAEAAAVEAAAAAVAAAAASTSAAAAAAMPQRAGGGGCSPAHSLLSELVVSDLETDEEAHSAERLLPAAAAPRTAQVCAPGDHTQR
jgi:hypothetical protein